MTSETDEQFVERISREVYPGFDGWRTVSMMDHSLDRLFALARRGAAMQWRPIEEEYEGEVLLWPRGSAVPSHFMPLPPPPAGETNE